MLLWSHIRSTVPWLFLEHKLFIICFRNVHENEITALCCKLSYCLNSCHGIQRLILWSWPMLLLICLESSIVCHMCLTFFSCLGKYQSGVDKPDPKTWKANFRCAMNSLPDIEEVKDKSIKKGNNAFRVYRMLPLSERPSKKGRRESFVNMKCCWGHCVEKNTCCR